MTIYACELTEYAPLYKKKTMTMFEISLIKHKLMKVILWQRCVIQQFFEICVRNLDRTGHLSVMNK